MIPVSDEQRYYLNVDGPPLPIIDDEDGSCYMLMPVTFTRGSGRRILARVPGIRAVGEADQPTEALATLAVLIKEVMDQL